MAAPPIDLEQLRAQLHTALLTARALFTTRPSSILGRQLARLERAYASVLEQSPVAPVIDLATERAKRAQNGR